MLFRTDAGVIMCSFHLLALHIIIKRTLFYKIPPQLDSKNYHTASCFGFDKLLCSKCSVWKSEIVKKNEKRKKKNNLHQHCLSHWLTR